MKRFAFVVVGVLALGSGGCGSSTDDGGSGSGGAAGTDAGNGGGGTLADGSAGTGGTAADSGTGGAPVGPEKLRDGLKALALAVDSENLYWIESIDTTSACSIKSCPLGGCGTSQPAEVVVDAMSAASLLSVGGLLYWSEVKNSDSRWLRSCHPGNCGSPSLISNDFAPSDSVGLVADAKDLFWGVYAWGKSVSLRSIPLSGGSGVSIPLLGSGLQGFTTDGTDVYYLTGAQLVRASGPYHQTQTVMAATGGMGISAFDGSVYWWTADGLLSCPTNGCGTAPTKLVAGPAEVSTPHMGETRWAETVVKEGQLYSGWRYTNPAGVFRCDLPTCASWSVVAEGTSTRSLVLDSQFAYWIGFDANDPSGPNAIYRTAR